MIPLTKEVIGQLHFTGEVIDTINFGKVRLVEDGRYFLHRYDESYRIVGFAEGYYEPIIVEWDGSSARGTVNGVELRIASAHIKDNYSISGVTLCPMRSE